MIRAQGTLFIEVLPTPNQEHADGGPVLSDSPRDRAASQVSGVDEGNRARTAHGSVVASPVRLGVAAASVKSAPESSPLEIRLGKKAQIYRFFLGNIGKRFSSRELHWQFGSAVRSRISDINRDSDLKLNILNETKVLEGRDASLYWAVLRVKP